MIGKEKAPPSSTAAAPGLPSQPSLCDSQRTPHANQGQVGGWHATSAPMGWWPAKKPVQRGRPRGLARRTWLGAGAESEDSLLIERAATYMQAPQLAAGVCAAGAAQPQGGAQSKLLAGAAGGDTRVPLEGRGHTQQLTHAADGGAARHRSRSASRPPSLSMRLGQALGGGV